MVVTILASVVCAGEQTTLPGDQSGIAQRLVEAPPPSEGGRPWPSVPPKDCPFEPSSQFSGVSFTGRQQSYTTADTWYPSWGSDDKLYSSWTDGQVENHGSGSGGDTAATGQAVIEGTDPLNLKVTSLGTFPGSPRPYEGRYPCGALMYNDIWYIGTYCLHPSWQVVRDGIPYNWPWMGPFVGFRTSSDFGKAWQAPPTTPAKPLFGESALNGEPVKIGAPHFVDFGKNMQHSPDGKAYLVAQGASKGPAGRRFAYNSWITADEAYLVRVSPSIENINDASKYEYFAGHDAANVPQWTSDFARIQPLAAWPDHMGCVTMTYVAPLKKFIMCVTDGGTTVSRYTTYLLESDRITGPWKMAAYLQNFGEQAYFVNIPSKFISADGESLFLCYSANFSSGWGGIKFMAKPAGSRYALCLQEMHLRGIAEKRAATPLVSPENIAPIAEITVSSTTPGYSTVGLVDGVVDGYPNNTKHEWCTRGESDGAFVRLEWGQARTITRVWLFDRPNDLDHITSGMLIFSDGSTLVTGELPDDGRKGLEIAFPAKKARWMLFVVTATRGQAPNVGLSEIAVFGEPEE
jgi:hypothetical protein